MVVWPHRMILLQEPQTGVLPESSGACWAACRMELRFSMGVGWAGCVCCVNTVLVLSGRNRSAKLGSVTHGGREEGPELAAAAAAAAVLEPEPPQKKQKTDRTVSIHRCRNIRGFEPSTQEKGHLCCRCDSCSRHAVALASTLNENLLAQMLLGSSKHISRSRNSPSG